jgi:DNA (cytosine-5)-methyltransferase 1
MVSSFRAGRGILEHRPDTDPRAGMPKLNQNSEITSPHQPVRSLRTAGLFAGIGGIELGLKRHGHPAVFLSEIEPAAQIVLRTHFPGVCIQGDIRDVGQLPLCDLVVAGFPCQDLSQCGKTKGIGGRHSSLVGEVFRLVEAADRGPNWIVLENVPFMLKLDRGEAMNFITAELRRLGYRWAYRTVDARAFGLPQRRLRVVLAASRTEDPRTILFADDQVEPTVLRTGQSYGFYWTEGSTGLGWAIDSVPTLKGGSGLGIPSPPAVWIPASRTVETIDVRDAERLQGFRAGWTNPAQQLDHRAGTRWRLVGNAVCVRVAAWIGRRLARPGMCRCNLGGIVDIGASWPSAAYGDEHGIRAVNATTWPIAWRRITLLQFLRYPTRPLSARATAGFLSRASKSQLTFADGFLADLKFHLGNMASRGNVKPDKTTSKRSLSGD